MTPPPLIDLNPVREIEQAECDIIKNDSYYWKQTGDFSYILS